MSLFAFAACCSIGIPVWSDLLAWLDFLLGDNYELVEEEVGPIGTWIWPVLAAILVAWILWRLRGCTRHFNEPCPFRDEEVGEHDTTKASAPGGAREPTD